MPLWSKLKPSTSQLLSVAWIVTIMVYVAWSTAFIVRSSFVSVFGKWVFCLFDDSMISMRFAHNFSRGLGLVWNPGEHVEGYTNFLYTIIMAVPQLFLNASRSCLFMQVLGIVWVLFAAFLASRIIGAVTDGRSLPLMRLAAFIATLSLYPLSYWPLMGMETGLLTVLVLLSIVIALRGRKDPSLSKALLLGATLSLAYLTRPDSFLYACAIGVYLFSLRRSSKEVLYRKKNGCFLRGSTGDACNNNRAHGRFQMVVLPCAHAEHLYPQTRRFFIVIPVTRGNRIHHPLHRMFRTVHVFCRDRRSPKLFKGTGAFNLLLRDIDGVSGIYGR
jgi:hypothetical protein